MVWYPSPINCRLVAMQLCALPTEVECGRGSMTIRTHCPINILHSASITDLSVACNLVRELQGFKPRKHVWNRMVYVYLCSFDGDIPNICCKEFPWS